MTWFPAKSLCNSRRAGRFAWAGLTLVLSGLVLFGAAVSLTTLNASRRVHRSAELSTAYENARFAIATEETLEERYRVHPDPQVLASHAAAAHDLEAALEEVQRLCGPRDAAVAADALNTQQRYLDAISRLFAAVDLGDTDRVEQLDQDELDPIVTALQNTVRDAAQRHASHAASELESVNQTQTVVLIATVLAFVIGSSLLGAFWYVITGYQRRLAASALREVDQARQSEERFRSLVQNMSDAILILDSAGVIRYASPAAEHGWGYDDGELLGRSALSLLVAEEQARARAQFVSGCQQPGATWRTELHLRNADGSIRDVEAIAINLLDRPAVGGVVFTYRDITERNTHERTLKELAFLDNLTGLANWSRLRSELERLLAAGPANNEFGLLLLDIDSFREVNDTFGHQRGDQLLRQVGERLAAQLADGDVVARLGGDEFAMLLRGVDAGGARARADRLLAALDLPFESDGAPVQLSASIGIALHPDHGSDADMLLSRADIAMYTAKDTRSGCVLYAPEQDHHSPERLALVHDLRRAIERDEFVLHFQPQIDVRSGMVSGCEALVRWQHPVRGLLSPDKFIPLAVHSRLIQPLSRWVLRTALVQVRAWRSAGLNLPVSVNLSAYDLRDAKLPDYIAELLACDAGLAHRLRIEITESSLMVDPDGSREVLGRLREQGVQIAIDDFGTGYSSLSYLKDLPVDELKIDKSFVRDMATDPGARAIVRAIIDLADDLQLRVVAEGVEDRATWEALAALGCDLAQGYYFSPPLAADDLVVWVRNSEHDLESDEARRVESALAERVRQRGARLTAEEEFMARKRAEAALRESEERLRLAIDAADIATWDWDLARQVITWTGGPSVSCASPHTSQSGLETFLACVHPDDRFQLEAAVRNAIDGSGELQVEHRIIRPDGSVGWLVRKGRVVCGPGGRPVRLLGTDVDITERKEAEQQRESLATTEKLRALGQMASGVAHDLNQSLVLIAGFSDLAARALDDPGADIDSAREALATVARAAMDGGQTVKRLLMFARGRPDSAREPVNLESLLREVAQLTAPRWRDAAQSEGRPITVQIDAAGDTRIIGSPASLREAFTNLVFNAVDALPTGGKIQLAARPEEDHVVVTVVDSGTGMTPEVQARIFEPFFTTKADRGTGLGLAQVFGIIEQHHGHVEVDSAPGRGTTFRLFFPAASVKLAPATVSQPARSKVEHRLRILAVDDEPMIGAMVARVLRPDGHLIVTATSGEEALQRLQHERFDLVISDIGMGPGINGWDLATQVGRYWPGVAFVLATGWGATIDPAEARTRGVLSVIAKPYRAEELSELVATIGQRTGRDYPNLEAA